MAAIPFPPSHHQLVLLSFKLQVPPQLLWSEAADEVHRCLPVAPYVTVFVIVGPLCIGGRLCGAHRGPGPQQLERRPSRGKSGREDGHYSVPRWALRMQAMWDKCA